MKIYFRTLGCPKNEVDSEIMMGLVSEMGYHLVSEPELAEIIVVNTCAFIEPAKEESIHTILELADYKEMGHCRALIVTGCLSQRYQAQLAEELPEVDAFLGTDNFAQISKVVAGLAGGEQGNGFQSETGEGSPSVQALYEKRFLPQRGKGKFFSYLKIAEGCNNSCSYCVIPAIRGPLQSRPLEDVLQEARKIVATGCREIILVAQDTTRYGLDLYGEPRLVELLRRMVQLEGLDWIRIMYAYPTFLTDELIDLIASEEKIVDYIDIPLQHSHPDILSKMNRPYAYEDIVGLLARLRERIPGLVIRTSIIVGFPGEGEEEFQHLYQFVQKSKFGRMGVFTYSREEGTPACKYPGQVPEDVKEERRQALMQLQQRISMARNEQLVGTTVTAVVEEIFDDNFRRGRSKQDAPEIDNGIIVRSNANPGQIIAMKVTGAETYDLIGEEI